MIIKRLNNTTNPQQKYNKFHFVAETDNIHNLCCAFVALVIFYFTDN
jgi:hypothetical protein